MKTYVIAEAGVNHNGYLNFSLQLVDAAVEAGVPEGNQWRFRIPV